MAQRRQQETKAIPVRSLDGRTTTVRLAAACSVDDLKAALRASNFPPPAGAPTFHLFLKGAKLLPQARVGNLPIYAGDFVSLIPFTAKPTTPAPFGRHAFSPSPWAAAGTRRKLPGSWSGGGDDDVYAPNKVARTPSSSCSNHCCGTEPLDPAQMVEHLRRGLGKHGQIAHVERMPGSGASFADDDLLHHLTDAMRSCLRSTGVTRLYAHQAQAVRAAVAGKHVVVSTSTSSG